ncbi:MAG: PTS sugar transporter subunit IIA [candidate division KSB1 bacterium]|nr:PTS sugar transporter subunit IIA [candidate division KSB1 bacterium]MDZ7300841.1 PTS sugar transporter subunit IIA [candidate division KSB1 bacterium]MDZ7309888.1 PTS sugar transporter subunit IIA [candidate division KSB1 bacterium]
MKLKDILSENLIKIHLSSQEKRPAIEEMVDLLFQSGYIKDRNDVLKAILDREAVMSTGVGDEVAIPHGKSEAAPTIVVALGIAKKPIEFQSMDDRPVRLIWLLVGPPDQTGPHLKALSRISRLMHKREFREQLLASQNAKEALNAIIREEDKYLES